MAEDDVRRRELGTRNAELRTRIDGMLSDLRRRTEELHAGQVEAAGTARRTPFPAGGRW